MLRRGVFFIGVSIVIVSIAGCATPYDLKRTEPKFHYYSNRPATDVMKCIRDKWREHQTSVYEEKTSDGWLIRHDEVFPGTTAALVMIEGSSTVTKVSYFQKASWVKDSRLQKEIMACKGK